MFVMDCYGHKLSNGVLFAHHLILDVPGGSSHLGYRRRVPLGHYPTTTGVNRHAWRYYMFIACMLAHAVQAQVRWLAESMVASG